MAKNLFFFFACSLLYLFIKEAYKPIPWCPALQSPEILWCGHEGLSFQSGPSKNGFHFKSPNSSISEVSENWQVEGVKMSDVLCGRPNHPLHAHPSPWHLKKYCVFLFPTRVSSFPSNCSQGTGGHHEAFQRRFVFVCSIDFNSLKNGVFYLSGHRRATRWGKHFFFPLKRLKLEPTHLAVTSKMYWRKVHLSGKMYWNFHISNGILMLMSILIFLKLSYFMLLGIMFI